MDRRAKWRDLASATPLLLWFALSLAGSSLDFAENLRTQASALALVSGVVGVAFFALLIGLVLVRRPATAFAAGWLPRATALLAVALPFLFLLLARAGEDAARRTLSDTLILVGTGAGIVCAAWLGRSFGVLPHARGLVTDGPYRLVRHPLYVAEALLLCGVSLRYQSPASTMVLLLCVAALLPRLYFEEQTLRRAYPEYAEYAKRTARLAPGIY